MVKAKIYRKYPPAVKAEIVRTGNLYLFPDLKIPRTTAQYWIRSERRFRSHETVDLAVRAFRERAEQLTLELEKERALRRLLETVRRIFPYSFASRHVRMKSARTQIVSAVRQCLAFQTLNVCLRAIGLTESSYRRWASENMFCDDGTRGCKRRSHAQLTGSELDVMKSYVTRKKYAHISISSLHLLAQREGQLFCSLDTWYKYIRYFEWERPETPRRPKVLKEGIRTSAPNEIWHLDVSVVVLSPGVKLYIQAVIDNYSRYVLACRVTKKIGAESTIETIKFAKERLIELSSEPCTPTHLMSDPGTENMNHAVAAFLPSKNLVRLIAQVDVHYSNSMIESLFRSLKNRYLDHQRVTTIAELERKVRFYVKQHNEVIPQAVLRGATPNEMFRALWTPELIAELKKQHEQARLTRRRANSGSECMACPNLYTPLQPRPVIKGGLDLCTSQRSDSPPKGWP